MHAILANTNDILTCLEIFGRCQAVRRKQSGGYGADTQDCIVIDRELHRGSNVNSNLQLDAK